MLRGAFARHVASQVRDAREAMNASREELCDGAGIELRDLVKIERGTAVVDAWLLCAIASALFCEVTDLVPPQMRGEGDSTGEEEPQSIETEPDAAETQETPASRSKTYSLRELQREANRNKQRGITAEKTPVDDSRPKTRAECAGGERPCLYVSCKYHLYLDVNPSGSLKLNFPDKEPGDMVESCALDVADRGGATLEEVGALTNVIRERVRQVEDQALERMRRPALDADLDHLLEFDPSSRRDPNEGVG